MKTKKAEGKQAYEKPKLRPIELAAAEVLAVGCKVRATTPGPINVCHPGSGCYKKGS